MVGNSGAGYNCFCPPSLELLIILYGVLAKSGSFIKVKVHAKAYYKVL